MPLRPSEIPHAFRASESARGAIFLLLVIRPLPAPTAPDVDALPGHIAERCGPLGHDGHLRQGEMYMTLSPRTIATSILRWDGLSCVCAAARTSRFMWGSNP